MLYVKAHINMIQYVFLGWGCYFSGGFVVNLQMFFSLDMSFSALIFMQTKNVREKCKINAT